MAGRTLYLGLRLLDRQLIDRHDRLVGNVDDLEITAGPSGELYVSAIVSGPGALAQRMGAKRFGAWLQRMHRVLDTSEARDPALIDFGRVSDIGASVKLAADQEELGTQATHDWVARHIIGHIPGSRRATE